MKIKIINSIFSTLLLITSCYSNAGIINITLGNGGSGLTDGDVVPDLLVDLAQSGQPSPFDNLIGNDLTSDPGNVNWLFNYGVITDTIISVSFSLGIWDLDSSASGSQLDAFSLDGTSLTTSLDTLFESGGGTSNHEYNIFSFNLDSSFFTDLIDGIFSVDLNIGGKGLKIGGTQDSGVTDASFNGYRLVYSSLTIETQDFAEPDPDPEPPSVPEPTTLAIFALGIIALSLKRVRDQ